MRSVSDKFVATVDRMVPDLSGMFCDGRRCQPATKAAGRERRKAADLIFTAQTTAFASCFISEDEKARQASTSSHVRATGIRPAHRQQNRLPRETPDSSAVCGVTLQVAAAKALPQQMSWFGGSRDGRSERRSPKLGNTSARGKIGSGTASPHLLYSPFNLCALHVVRAFAAFPDAAPGFGRGGIPGMSPALSTPSRSGCVSWPHCFRVTW